ncbi:hypothetical protein C8R47DRAFT_997775 [Mycena vitilis]|nr:hypothetical protein C8R47DRAFT_997775 [Mycena vitilis]
MDVSTPAETTALAQAANLAAPNLPPKITIIAIYTTHSYTPQHHTQMFWQGVEANPSVNLLFINVDRDNEGCDTYQRNSNSFTLQEVCLSRTEYFQLHVDFLCKRWQCLEEDRAILLDTLLTVDDGDYANSYYRMFRAGVFAKWIRPETTIWGWCDVDIYWGSFERIFPWDVAADFDILAPASTPNLGSKQLLFTRGHMAFFRHSPDMQARLHAYPKFVSLGAFLTSSIDDAAEEGEFSHYYFGASTNFTFLFFEGMVESPWTIALVSTQGTFFLADTDNRLLQSRTEGDIASTADARKEAVDLVARERSAGDVATFSKDGVVNERKVRIGDYGDWTWFKAQYATWFDGEWSRNEMNNGRTFFMRLKAGGPTYARLEPRARHIRVKEGGVGLQLQETLYKHFQVEKRHKWFLNTPQLQPGQFYVQYPGSIFNGSNWSAEVWNEKGEIVYAALDAGASASV